MKHGKQKEGWDQFSGPNMGYLYDQYEKFLKDPASVDPTIKSLFDTLGAPPIEEWKPSSPNSAQQQQSDIKKVSAGWKLLNNIRTLGHLAASIYPLELQDNADAEMNFLNLENYNLQKEDLAQLSASWLWEDAPSEIQNGWEAFRYLKAIYTQTIAYEFEHIHDGEERKWLESYVEHKKHHYTLSDSERIELLERLLQVDYFEQFLHKTFVGQKRFSLEGLDMLVPMLDRLIEAGSKDKVENIMIGMAHRGRLNVLAHVLGKPYKLIFSEFHHSPNKDLIPSEGSRGINFGWSGDVKYHLGADREIEDAPNHTIHISLANNPSHLEFVNPVVQGMTRASQENRKEAGVPKQNKQASFSVCIHGDAAFPGEGVVAETLNLSKLKGYDTGGTIHIIANNMLGFTTNYDDSRSTKYASDLAKGFEIPIIHVNADDPESCLQVIMLAYDYRKRFKKDILIDLLGYRRYGHNEMDDPMATQPTLYDIINKHERVAEKYKKEMIAQKLISEKEANQKVQDFMNGLQRIYDQLIEQDHREKQNPPVPNSIVEGVPRMETAVQVELLQQINNSLLKRPMSFTVYPKLERILSRRETALAAGSKIDWALAENLAFATILADGVPIRLTGQDSERGTFAHRHLVLHDYKTNERFIPLHSIPEAKASFSIHNSPLSEAAVLGNEYGYSVKAQEALVIWEAQFGDFANAAEVIIDQFISSGRAKWGQKSSLVMLLPHGYEGQGPEHSSARLERFLQLSAENNWIVANVTSAAQYFHILRRQASLTGTEDARPLVLMAPKSLLRHPSTSSSSSELSNGMFFPLLEQKGTGTNRDQVRRLILCCGKIAIDLAVEMEQLPMEQRDLLHIARVEQLYPFPKKEVVELLEQFPNVDEIIWVQEEPKNMGAWPVIQSNLTELAEKQLTVGYIGRRVSSSPATGDPNIHKQEQTRIIQSALQYREGGVDYV